MPKKVICIAPETATALRDLSRQATEAYNAEEFPALNREDDRIEVVSLAEYLSDTHKGRWC